MSARMTANCKRILPYAQVLLTHVVIVDIPIVADKYLLPALRDACIERAWTSLDGRFAPLSYRLAEELDIEVCAHVNWFYAAGACYSRLEEIAQELTI